MINISMQFFGGRGGGGSGGARGGGRAGGGGGAARSSEQKAAEFTVRKEGRIFAARTPDGYMISSGSDQAAVAAKAKQQADMLGVTLGQKIGETRTVTPNGVSKEGFERALRTADVGSTVTLKNGSTFTKTAAGHWEGMDSSVWGGVLSGNNKKRMTIVGADRFTYSTFSSMSYKKRSHY